MSALPPDPMKIEYFRSPPTSRQLAKPSPAAKIALGSAGVWLVFILLLLCSWDPPSARPVQFFLVTVYFAAPVLACAVAGVRLLSGASSRRDLLLLTLAVTLGASELTCVAWTTTHPLIRDRETSMKVRCASNLRQIGQAILMYANENHNRCPDTINQILATQDITAEVFNCPSTSDTPATGPTTQATAANLTTPGHCSYVYLAKGVNLATCDPNRVLVYEPLANHGGDGLNALFGDGHVEFINGKDAKGLLADLKSRKNPSASIRQ